MVNHPATICPYCGQEIKRNSGTSPGSTFYGDRSYVDYTGHKCNPIRKFFYSKNPKNSIFDKETLKQLKQLKRLRHEQDTNKR